MNQTEAIPLLRRFYRAHLARYPWARLLKRIYLVLRLQIIHIRAFLIWHVIPKVAFAGTRFSRAESENNHLLIRYAAKLSSFFFSVLLRALYFPTGLKAWYKMQGFSEYMRGANTSSRVLVPERKLSLPMPTIYPEDFKKYFHGGWWPLSIPAISAFEVSKAQVLGKSDMIFVEDRCLHHDLYRFDQDFLFEEMHGAVGINPFHKELVRFKGQHSGSIQSGISLLGSATSNYVHWLTETLPKLALINEIDVYRDLPYLIDAGLHPNILESVQHFNNSGRQLIQIKRDEIFAVDRLIAISPVAYVPFDFHHGIKAEKIDINPGTALYSPDALQRVRDFLVARLGDATAPKKKLFLRRTGKSRPMDNAIEIEALVLAHGFEIIEPETLSFAQQVCLFSSTELIVSQGGAALGNILFAPTGCHVIVLTTWSPYTIHYYFANLAAVLGQRCTLIMCEPVQSELGPHRAHMGVNVPIPILKKAIQQ